jgi:hypothetical protein
LIPTPGTFPFPSAIGNPFNRPSRVDHPDPTRISLRETSKPVPSDSGFIGYNQNTLFLKIYIEHMGKLCFR